MKDIYKLKLGEFNFSLDAPYPIKQKVIERVPGGWNYIYFNSENNLTSEFVPWHDSGRMIEKSGNYEELRAKLKKAEDTLKEIQNELIHDYQEAEELEMVLENIELILKRFTGENE